MREDKIRRSKELRKKNKKRKNVIDKMAAVLILQTYLDKLN